MAFLKKTGVTIYGNQNMMLLNNIDLDDVAPEVTPIALNRMVDFFQSADHTIVY
ncbi:MAG TPA: hypothetical protein VLA60_11415 [Nitrospirales bacterium]|nr:hypothetical protein [Nitrospirales bacterium]